MNRLLFVIAVAVLVAGCNKRGAPVTDDKSAAQVEPPKPPSKKQEPPRLTPRHRFKTGIPEIARVAITDDGTRVAVSSDGLGNKEQIEIWDLNPEPKKVREIPGILRAFSPDGKLLARPGKMHGETEVVDATTGTAVGVIPDIATFYRFTGPDRVVMVRSTESLPGGKPGALRVSIYDARTGKRESGFEIPSTDFADILGPVNGRRELVVGWGSMSRVEVWDLGTGKMVRGVTLPNAQPKGSWANFETSPDGKRVTARRMGPVGVYDTATGAEVATVGHPTSSAFVPSRDLILGHTSWTGEGFQTYNGWRAHDLTKNAIVADLPGSYLFPAISSDGRVMVTMLNRAAAELLVWDLTHIP
jgi:hypothetical protein